MPRRRIHLATLYLCLFPTFAAAADGPPPKWDVTRATPPDDVAELRALQDTVKKVVDKTTPATVGVLLGMGAGSGVIVSPDGLVLTAAHVIDPGGTSGSVTLYLANGRRVKGKVLGRNQKADSGMIQITDKVPKDAEWPGAKEGKWPFVEIADSSDLKKGQWVVSLGHPGGPKPERRAPVRVGQIQRLYQREKVIVSDCTLVGGDSGGPLFDMAGKLVGIHSRIGMTLEDNIHVPTKAFKDEWEDLKSGIVVGAKYRAYLGVDFDEVAEEPVIKRVRDETPASKSGLEAGDLILKVNDEKVTTSDEVIELIKKSKPGEKLKLVVQRGDETLHLTVTLGRQEEGGGGRRPRN